MTLQENLLPNRTLFASSNTLVGGEATEHETLADVDTATYMTGTVTPNSFNFALSTLPLTNRGVVSATVKVMVRENASDPGTTDITYKLYNHRQDVQRLAFAPTSPFTERERFRLIPIKEETDTTVGSTFALKSFSAIYDLRTQDDLDSLVLVLGSDQIYDFDIAYAYVEIDYADLDGLVTIGGLPATYTASTRVPIVWYVDTAYGGYYNTPIIGYHIKVFDETTWGATYTGLDPDTDTAYWDSGQVFADTNEATVGPLAPGDGYRVFVALAQRVNGVVVWSPFDASDAANYDTFDLTVTASAVSSVTAAATDASGYITVTVNRDTSGGNPAWEYVEVQRSTDGGTTWADVRGAAFVDSTGNANTFTVADYEAPNDVAVDYRARATFYSGGYTITGAWVETSSTTEWQSTTDCWLKNPLDSTDNTTFTPYGRDPVTRNRRVGVFDVVGAKYPITVSDSRSGRSGVFRMQTADAAEADAIDAILADAPTILVQFPAKYDIDDMYATILADAESFMVEVEDVLYRVWEVEYVEVAAPADATAGTYE